MCICCMLHCDGMCDLQPGRVVKNGQSCYSGHCNTAIECMSKLSDDEKIQATIEFKKRSSENADMHTKYVDDDVDDVNNDDDNTDDLDPSDKVLVWYGVRCDACSDNMRGEFGYFYHGSNGRDYCTTCLTESNVDNGIYEKWSKLTCPYGGPNARKVSIFTLFHQDNSW